MNWKEIKKSLHEIADQLVHQDGVNCIWGEEIRDMLESLNGKVFIVQLSCRKLTHCETKVFLTKEEAEKELNSLPTWAESKYEFDQDNSYIREGEIW